ncbi:S-(hydroxymethyl)glutathione dehydrogenase/alcohol dehydrogenase [Paraburkholderia sp. BL27I4N3]|uniref:zinc-binding dehydrogenase n=1 Tax=Paraburkholderia sp. BL27I4N3 TaxID=1938805 RepID=UPI000E27BF92|nr:Zn-dependent alcohol dehydrogenase [Paraburkholderia sp. BL27I4N3]REE18127.1 S-(hydroxymethyl)glutathione dehydrogenase/alcohol dehydrogenase [Paraburkholderia sp. BL27I4N3]
MRCRAAILYEYNKPMKVKEIEIGEPKEGEVLVKVAASGVCHSDLSAAKGLYGDLMPAILGHEGAGVVESVGPGVDHVSVGDHVILSWKPTCGHCRSCLRGRPNLCDGANWIDTGRMKDGTSRYKCDGQEILHFAGTSTFAEYTVVAAECAIRIEKDLPLIPMSLVGCAVTTGVGAALNTAHIQPGDTVAVIGCGGVGLSAIQGARIAGAGKIIAIDQSDGALALAQSLGATHVVNSARDAAVEAVMEISKGGVDCSIEAVGRQATMELAVAILHRGGEAILAGVARSDVEVSFRPFVLVRREHEIRGSFYGSATPEVDFPRFADFYRQGKLDLDTMVKVRRLDEINDIMAEIEIGPLGRSVIQF